MRISDWSSDVCSSDLLRETRFPDAVRPPRNIEDAAGQRLVHRRVRFAIAGDAALVAQRLGDSLAERECRILDRVILVALQSALHRHREADPPMARQLPEQTVEEHKARRKRKACTTLAINGELDSHFF